MNRVFGRGYAVVSGFGPGNTIFFCSRIPAIYKLPDLQRIVDLQISNADCTTAQFSPDGNNLAITRRESFLQVFDTKAGKRLYEIPRTEVYGEPTQPKFSHDGKTFAVGTDFIYRLWDASTGLELHPGGLTSPAKDAAFSPDGAQVATVVASSGYAAGILDISNGAVEPIIDYPSPFSTLNLSPDGSLMALADVYHRTVQMRRQGAVQDSCRFTISSSGNASLPISFSRDGKSILSIGDTGILQVWDALTCREMGKVQERNIQSREIHYLTNQEGTLAVLADGTLKIWQPTLAAQSKVVRLEPPPNYGDAVAFCSARNRVAWTQPTGQIYTQDLFSAKAPRRFDAQPWLITRLVFSPDGSKLASLSRDETVLIWDLSR